MTPQRSAAPSTAAPRRPARVAFVGAGPGDASLMTVAAVDLLARADAVITDRLTSADVLATLTADDVDVVDASHGEHGQQLTHAMRAKLVVKTAKAHRGGLVVRLMDGDPATFNGLAEEAQALVKADIDFDVVPGVSAVSAVPTYAGVPLTARSTGAVHVVSLSSGKRVDLSASVGDDVTLVLLGLPEQLEPAFASLLSAGRAGETPVAVTRGGTTTQQTTRVPPWPRPQRPSRVWRSRRSPSSGRRWRCARPSRGSRPSRSTGGRSSSRGPRTRPAR